MASYCSRFTRKVICSGAAGLLILTGAPVRAETFGAAVPRVMAQVFPPGGPPPGLPPGIAPPRGVPPRGVPPGQQWRRPTQRSIPLPKSQVRRIQAQLRTLGYYRGSVDGIYGSGTRRAVARFQRARGIKPDGIAGPATLRALSRTAARRGRVETPQTFDRQMAGELTATVPAKYASGILS